MAEIRADAPSPAPPRGHRSSTTLLLRRLSADPELVGRVLSLTESTLPRFWPQKITETRGLLGPEAQEVVYVLVDVGAARDDEPLAGALATFPSGSGEVVLAAVAVEASWRGRGLGGRLLGEVVDDLRTGGVLRVWAALPTGAGPGDDSICARLFRRRGFRLSPTGPDGQARRDADWMVLEL